MRSWGFPNLVLIASKSMLFSLSNKKRVVTLQLSDYRRKLRGAVGRETFCTEAMAVTSPQPPHLGRKLSSQGSSYLFRLFLFSRTRSLSLWLSRQLPRKVLVFAVQRDGLPKNMKSGRPGRELIPCWRNPVGEGPGKWAHHLVDMEGSKNNKFWQLRGDFPLNHKMQNGKMFRNDNHDQEPRTC